MVRVFISLSPWKKTGGAFTCWLTDAALAWFERASFVNVRDRRDPAVLAAVTHAARNGAIYRAKRKLQTAHSERSPKPFPPSYAHGGEAAGSWRNLTLANMGVSSFRLGRRTSPFGYLSFAPKVLRGSKGNFFKNSPWRVPSHPPDKPKFEAVRQTPPGIRTPRVGCRGGHTDPITSIPSCTMYAFRNEGISGSA